MKLYTYPNNKNAYKVLVAAEYAGVAIEVPHFRMGQDNRTDWFLAMNPNGKVPVLETEDDAFFESNAIARYVARVGDSNGLLGKTLMERAQIEQWIDFSSSELDPAILSWCLPLIGIVKYTPRGHHTAMAATERAMKILEEHLTRTGGEHLVGSRVTLADIVCFCNLILGYKNVFDAAYRDGFPVVTRYFLGLASRPEFRKILGVVQLCSDVLKPPDSAQDS